MCRCCEAIEFWKEGKKIRTSSYLLKLLFILGEKVRKE